MLSNASPSAETRGEPSRRGEAVYDFYCYQCHGHSGDANTLAATYLDPRPRDFVSADPALLSRETMLDAVINGRPGTAMTSFGSVLDAASIERVVDFIRTDLMSAAAASSRRYHTAENGWPDHDRFYAAFPFATGRVALDTDWQALTETQKRGRALYLKACITCHDHGGGGEERLTWDLRPLSYPRDHYSHLKTHVISGASPYAIHDLSPELGESTPALKRGQQLYEENCAFCHAMDGTGRNWIGSFMEPHPRDLTDRRFAQADRSALMTAMRDGLPGTSMPAWRDVLTSDEMSDIAAYVRDVLATSDAVANPRELPAVSRRLIWRRRPPHAIPSQRAAGGQ